MRSDDELSAELHTSCGALVDVISAAQVIFNTSPLDALDQVRNAFVAITCAAMLVEALDDDDTDETLIALVRLRDALGACGLACGTTS